MSQGGTHFWKTRTLEEMSQEEWESLCDGCAVCCLEKIQDDDTGIVWLTPVPCKYLDISNCMCTVYEIRTVANPSCIKLTPEKLPEIHWLPETCAYRIIAQGGDLPWWHPLISGDRNSVHEAGVSARAMVVSAVKTRPEDLS